MDKQKPEMKKAGSAGVVDGIIKLNNLKYALPSNISVVNSRAYQQQFADQQSYASNSGTELNIRLQSSQGYCYGPNSYLRFDVLCSGLNSTSGQPYAVGFMKSDATSLFSRFLLEDKSGQELERVEAVNEAVRNCLPWKYPSNYNGMREMAGQSFQTVASVVTAADIVNGSPSCAQACGGVVTDNPGVNNFTKLRVTIPLSYFSGIFSCETFIPANLISGMLIRLTLADLRSAVQIIAKTNTYAYNAADDANAIFTISDPVAVLDLHNLSPVFAKNLMEESQGGLPFPYSTLYNQQSNPGTASSFVVQINKAVSRASRIWTYSQDSAVVNNIVHDNLGTAALAYRSYQTRIGSLYMPFQPIIIPNASSSLVDAGKNSSELYINNLQALNAIRPLGYHNAAPSLSKNAFSEQTPNNNSNRGTIIQTLEQSAPLAYAGVSINNSRTAEQRIEYSAGKPTNQTITSFLEYIKVAVVYPVKAVIKE